MTSPGAQKALLCAVTLCFWFAQYVYVPFLTPYLLSLAISATVVGVIIGAYGLTQLVLRIPLGIALDIHRRHKLVVQAGVLLAGLSSVGMLLFPSPLMLFVANALSGVASSSWISFTILYTSYYKSEQSTRAIGTISVFFQGGILLGFLLGGLLFTHYGINLLFKLSFAAGLVGFLLMLLLPDESRSKGTNVSVASLLKVLHDRRVVGFSLLSGVAWFVVFATVFSFATSTAKSMGATGTELGLFSMLYSVGTMLGSYFIATRFGHDLGERRPLVLGFVLMGLYSIALGFIRPLWLFYPLQLVCGFGNGLLLASTMAFAIKYVDAEKKTTAMGCFQSIYCFGITGGPIVMGMLMDHSNRATAFTVVGLCALVTAVLVPWLYRAGVFNSRTA